MDEIAAGLKKLEYAGEWIANGFLDPELLRQQLVIFDNGEDRNTEHYRYAAFCHILGRTSLTDTELDQLLHLISIDPDRGMATAVQYKLIDWIELTTEQRARLRRQPMFSEGRLQRQFTIYDLLVELGRVDNVSDLLYEQCMATGDETLQRKIVEHRGVTRAQIEQLVEYGKSKAVRNMAAARVRRMDAAVADELG